MGCGCGVWEIVDWIEWVYVEWKVVKWDGVLCGGELEVEGICGVGVGGGCGVGVRGRGRARGGVRGGIFGVLMYGIVWIFCDCEFFRVDWGGIWCVFECVYEYGWDGVRVDDFDVKGGSVGDVDVYFEWICECGVDIEWGCGVWMRVCDGRMVFRMGCVRMCGGGVLEDVDGGVVVRRTFVYRIGGFYIKCRFVGFVRFLC